MRKRVEKPNAKRAPAKKVGRALFADRHRTKTAGNNAPQLDKLLHDTYARRACHL